MKTKTLSLFLLVLTWILSACSTFPITSSSGQQPTPVVESGLSNGHEPVSSTELPVVSTTIPAATSEAPIPAGWLTYTSQHWEYGISYPAGMQATAENQYSQTFRFELSDPDEGARNFIYVSVIAPEIQDMVKQGVYLSDVYNYDPAETEILLSLEVNESASVREIRNVGSGFTYQRQPDTQISGYAAQTYENAGPWEFPVGTKEIRYYLSLKGRIYMIGGYMDTTGSDQPGVITPELFQQIIATVQLAP